MMPKEEAVIACDLNAIASEERDQHTEAVRGVFAVVQEVKEVSNGYAFRLPADSALLRSAAEFIANERLCCPFFEFSLTITPNGGPIWLQLAGAQGVKEFVGSEIMSLINLSQE
jgi:hypothetical protein